MRPSFFFCLLLSVVILVACDKADRLLAPTLFNTWTEVELNIDLYSGSNYTSLRKQDDSTFQLKLMEWGDLIIQGDPCAYHYDYYVKGVCSIANNEL